MHNITVPKKEDDNVPDTRSLIQSDSSVIMEIEVLKSNNSIQLMQIRAIDIRPINSNEIVRPMIFKEMSK